MQNPISELQHQQAVIAWSEQPEIRRKYPVLKLLYHIPNERWCTPAQGKQLKRAGVRSGVPDLFLPVPTRRYNGLYIEMKRPGETPTENQEWWMNQLRGQGYFAGVCDNWKKATEVLEWYLDTSREAGEERT